MQEGNEGNFDFEFRPLTKGLGFHQDDKSSHLEKIPLPPLTPKLNREASFQLGKSKTDSRLVNFSGLNPGQSLKSEQDLGSTRNTAIPEISLTSHSSYLPKTFLNPDFGAQSQVETKPSGHTLSPEQSYQMPSIAVAFGAWMLDLIFIFFSSVIVVLGFLFLAKWQGINLLGQFSMPDYFFYFGILFSFSYVFYFSVMDTYNSSSFGKKIFQIKVCNDDFSNLSFSQSFARAVFSLLAVFSLGVLSLIDQRGIITKSKLVLDK